MKFTLIATPRVVFKWFVSRILEWAGYELQCFKEFLALGLAELIEKRLRIGNLRKLQALTFQIGLVILRNFISRTPNHQVLQNLFASFLCIRLDRFEVLLSISLAIQAA